MSQQLYFIIAKNLAEYRDCVKEKLGDPKFAYAYPRKNIVLVTDPVHVKGYTVEHGCFYGNWRDNKYIVSILQQLIVNAKDGCPARQVFFRVLDEYREHHGL